MKTKMLTALLSSLFLAILACPVLAAPIDMLVAGYGLDASAIPTTFDAAACSATPTSRRAARS